MSGLEFSVAARLAQSIGRLHMLSMSLGRFNTADWNISMNKDKYTIPLHYSLFSP